MEKIKLMMLKKLSPTLFVLSMLITLTISMIFLIVLYFFINPKPEPISAKNYQPVTSARVSLNLDVSSPDDNLLIFENNLLVSGKTTPVVTILITLNESNELITASSQGDFSLTVKLSPGGNELIISAFDNLGNIKTESRTIYYSEAKL